MKSHTTNGGYSMRNYFATYHAHDGLIVTEVDYEAWDTLEDAVKRALEEVLDSADDIAKLIDDKTRGVYCESVGNPAGNVCDIEALAGVDAGDRQQPVLVRGVPRLPFGAARCVQ